MNKILSPLAKEGISLQKRAANPLQSVWVAASAGSGKTRVLVDRTLRLMLAGTRPERILCITFTKAAAAEMANRLNSLLGEWSVKEDLALFDELTELMDRSPTEEEMGRARRLFAHVLDTPGGLKIQTIHSFCESVLGRFPLESGIAPNFEVMDERTAAEILEAARDHLLQEARGETNPALAEALATVSEQVNEQDFASLMQNLSSRRGKLKRFLDGYEGLEKALSALAAFLETDPQAREEDLLSQACEEASFAGSDLRSLLEPFGEGGKTEQANAQKMEAWLANPDQRIALLEKYKSVFLTAKGEMKADRSLATKATLGKRPDALDIMRREMERLLDLQDRCNRVRVLKTTSALIRMGHQLIEEYNRQKALRGKLDYDDLILTTRDLLSARDVAPWVMFKLDGGIDHILVDEAQDTSPEQWEVIGGLAEEFFSGDTARDHHRTLFVVGDEKQSIYSFQGADPAAFDQMRLGFEAKAQAAEKKWELVPLDLSFRSTDAVLSLVDDIFSDFAARQGLTAESSDIRHYIFRENQAGFTEIWPPIKPPEQEVEDAWEIPLDQGISSSPAAELGDRIAGQIKSWLEQGETLASNGRKIRPRDIMILVQSRNVFFENMVRALKKAGIPVAGADRMVLTEQLAVMDLLALARFTLLPEDDLNLAVVLKGPFVGCDDNQLFDLAYNRKGSLWSALRDNKPGLPLFDQAIAFLRRQLARADFIPVYEFFASLLSEEGGRQKLLGRLGEEAADPIDEFLSLALGYQRTEATSLQAFLHWVEAGGAVVKRDMEQVRDEVRVLTVHGSKGLQAPIVFLPDTCQSSRAAGNTEIFWSDEETPKPLWPARSENDENRTRQARQQLKDRQQEEKKRLLYVALTRAEDRLYICGWEGIRGRASHCWYNLIDTAFGMDFEDKTEEILLPWGDVARRRSSGITKDEQEKQEKEAVQPVAALPSWALTPPAEEPSPPQPLTPSREEEEPQVRSPLGGDEGHRFHRGILIHRLLESLPDLSFEKREATARKWLARPAHKLSAAQQKEILKETFKVLEHPEFSEIFGPESMAEVPLTGLFGDQVMSGQIDRLLIKEDEILIIDYKTNRPSPTDVANVPAIYRRQMEIYRQALKKMYPEKPIKCGLLWTDTPHLMVLPSSE